MSFKLYLQSYKVILRYLGFKMNLLRTHFQFIKQYEDCLHNQTISFYIENSEFLRLDYNIYFTLEIKCHNTFYVKHKSTTLRSPKFPKIKLRKKKEELKDRVVDLNTYYTWHFDKVFIFFMSVEILKN